MEGSPDISARVEHKGVSSSGDWKHGSRAAELRRTYDDLSRLTPWQTLERTAARLPDKVAVIEGDRRTTYAELLEESTRLAAGFTASVWSKATEPVYTCPTPPSW